MIGEVTLYTDGRVEWHPEDATSCEVDRKLMDHMLKNLFAIQRLRDLHTAFNVVNWCRECGDNYPCDTIRALDGEQE